MHPNSPKNLVALLIIPAALGVASVLQTSFTTSAGSTPTSSTPSVMARTKPSTVVATVTSAASPTTVPTAQPTATTQPTLVPTQTPRPPTATALPTATAVPKAAIPKNVKPNELGKIMVLEYHVFGDEEERWTREWSAFRRDLTYLYEHGYYLVSFSDVLNNRLRVPEGKTPVVLTFDDSNRSQFQYVVKPDGSTVFDPKSAVGILEGFIADHPDFGRGGVFCVLPAADPPNDLFGQPELRQKKLQFLASNGYDLCNHTQWHAHLGQVGDREAVRQIALGQQGIQDLVPGYRVSIFNPPRGAYMHDVRKMARGEWEGIKYENRAILEVTGGAMTAPNHRKTDFLHVPRIQAIQSELDSWFGHFEKHPEERYVSDGDPDRLVIPTSVVDDFVAPDGARDLPAADPAYRIVQLR